MYLEDVRFEDVVSQLHRLLAIKLPLLAGKHESHQSVTGPEQRNNRDNAQLQRRLGNQQDPMTAGVQSFPVAVEK